MIPALPRGVRVKHDRVRQTDVLLGPERALMLDPIGAAVLAEVDGARPLDQIVTRLANRFGAPEDQVRGDVTAFLSDLKNRRLLEMRTS